MMRTNLNCDVCGSGVLTVRTSGDGRSFLGCSNYPSCTYTYKELDILKNHIKCSKCGGYLLKRKGPIGEFYGCSNFPYCRNSMDIKAYRGAYSNRGSVRKMRIYNVMQQKSSQMKLREPIPPIQLNRGIFWLLVTISAQTIFWGHFRYSTKPANSCQDFSIKKLKLA